MLQPSTKNKINHIVFVLDASGSMADFTGALIKVADAQVATLAETSKQLNLETRVTIYSFGDAVECLVYDMDVLRLPSIATLYAVRNEMTALLDAAGEAIADLQQTPQKYGDHAFLLYLLTDGMENRSRRETAASLSKTIAGLPDNWTLAALVPGASNAFAVKNYGFPNVAIWDATSKAGVEEAGRTMAAATQSYMTLRSGTTARSTTNLFNLNAAAVSAQTITAAGLTPLPYGTYSLSPIAGIPEKTQVSHYVNNILGLTFRLGSVYYQLTKPEKIAVNKLIALVDKKTDQVYVGREARTLLGLPDHEVKVAPATTDKYWIMVQSNSTNRHLVDHTKLLIMNR